MFGVGTRKGNLPKELPFHEIEDDLMYLRDGHAEMGFEVTLPSSVFYDDYSNLLVGLKGVLENELKEGMRLRFVLESGPADREAITRIRERVTAPETALRFLLEERAKLLEDDWHKGSVRGWRVYCTVRFTAKTKKFFTLSRETAKERRELADDVRRKMMGAFESAGYRAKPMTGQDIFRLLHRYLNPGQWHYDLSEYQPTWQRYAKKVVEKIPGTSPSTLRAQLAESKVDNKRSGHLIVGDHFVKMLALNKLPDRHSFVNMMEGALHGGEKFFVVIDLFHQPYHKGSTTARARARRFEGAANQTEHHVDAETRHLAQQTTGLVDHLVRTGDHLFLGSVGFVLYDQDLKRLNDRVEKLYGALQSVPGRPFRVLSQGLWTPFLQFAPFSGQDYTEKVTLTTSNATHFFPVNGPWKGAKKPLAFYRNRFFGVTGLDPFDGTNYNGLVIGSSGSGKTFFMNHILSELLADKATQVIIIDRGGGYSPLINLLDGANIPLRPGGGSRVNPFDIAPGTTEPSDQEKANLLKIIRAMIPGEAGAQREVEDAVLMAAIEQVYAGAKRFDRALEKDVFVAPTMTDFFKKLRAIDEVGEVRAEDDVRKLSRDLSLRLQGWTGETPLGKFVDGQTTVPISDARVVYYDTEGIASAGQLSVVGTMLIANLVWQRVRARRGQKTLVILDEGWAMLKESDEAKGFVEEMYRRFRRYGAGIWSVSQSYEEFQELRGITNNAELFFGLRVSQAERELWIREMQLPERVRKLLGQVHQVKGRYSEAMCIFRREWGFEGNIIAVHPTRADYWAFTTNDDDMALREAKVAENGGAFLPAIVDLAGDPYVQAA